MHILHLVHNLNINKNLRMINVVYVYKKMLQHVIIVKINILLEYVKNVLIN